MNQEEIKPVDAKQEGIETPEAITEKPLTIENIEAQITDLQSKLREMKRASEKTIQTEMGQIDKSVEKLDVESPEEVSTAKKEIGVIETEKQTIAKKANEKIQSALDVTAKPTKKEVLIQKEPTENKESAISETILEKLKADSEINKEEIIEKAKIFMTPKYQGEDYDETTSLLRKAIKKELLDGENGFKKPENVDISAVQKILDQNEQHIEEEKKLGKKFEVRQEAENIMREVKAMQGELDSEKGKLVLSSKITKQLRELMMQPGVTLEAGKKWTEFYKPIDEIDFNQVQEIIDQYNKADALDKEIDANATKDREEIESVYGDEPVNIDKVLKNTTNPDLKKTREEIKTKLFERVLKNKATEREMIMAEEYAAKAANVAGGTGFRTVPRAWYENKRLLKAMMKANKQINENYVENRLKQK